MPSLQDLMARGDAAGGAMRDSGMDGASAGGQPPMGPEQQPSDDLDGALAQVESIVQGLNPDIADQVRDHLNAIREIVAAAPEAKGGPDQGPPMDPNALPSPDAAAAGAMGMMSEKAPPM